MLGNEPDATAQLVGMGATILLAAAITGPLVARRGLPVVLGFILLGMLAGSEGIGKIAFDNYDMAFRIGTIALVLILFDGGLNTSIGVVKKAIRPASILATLGVMMTAGGVALAGWQLLGLPLLVAMLLGAVVSSTDAATVFSVLRGGGIHLQERVAATVELESGVNDPMAMILTLGLTQAVVKTQESVNAESMEWTTFVLTLLADVGVQLLLGAAFGACFGWLGLKILRLPKLAGALYPFLTLAIGGLAFGTATLLYGSGILAVFLAGLIIGNGVIPHRVSILRIHDFLGWGAQVAMFLALGLLVSPTELLSAEVVVPGLIISGVLILMARPLSIALCLPWFKYTPREVAFVSWVGLRGSVPIILGMVPMMAGVEQGKFIFNIVFFVVVFSVVVQGGTVGWVTSKMNLQRSVPPSSPTSLEIASNYPLDDDILSFFIDPAAQVCGQQLSALRFPDSSSAMLIVRGRELVAPRGHTRLEAGDHLYVFCKPEERDALDDMLLMHRDHAKET